MKTLGILLLCLLAWTQAAFGHAVLITSAPAAGAILDQAPQALVLEFNEPVGIATLSLLGPQGQPVTLGPVQSNGAQVRIALPAATTHGTYLFSWRASSADGHPVGGTLDFAIGAPTASAMPAAKDTRVWRDALIWAGRWLAFICLIAAGGAALSRAITPATREDWARRVIGIGLLVLVFNLALQGLDLLDAPWQALIKANTWRAALASPYAGTLGFAALSLAAAYRALDTHRVLVMRLAAASSLILLGIAMANSGHAGTAPPQWLSRSTVALHVIAAAAWLGALVPLVRGLLPTGQTTPASLPALSRFSRWITPVVALLILSGLTLAVLQLAQPEDLWRTAYGRILSAKLILVLSLLALAAGNRWRLTSSTLSGDAHAHRLLTHAIKMEIVLAILILAVVSLWRFTPPPRSLDTTLSTSASAMPASLTLANAQVRAQIRRSPGTADWTIQLKAPSGQAFAAQALTITLDNPGAGIEPLRREALLHTPGTWRVQLPALPATGHWRLGLDILVDDFDRVVLQTALSN